MDFFTPLLLFLCLLLGVVLSQFQYSTQLTIWPNGSENDFYLSFYHVSDYYSEDICFQYNDTAEYIPFFIEKKNNKGVNDTVGLWLRLRNFTEGEFFNITFFYKNDNYLNEECYEFRQDLKNGSFYIPVKHGCDKENGYPSISNPNIFDRFLMINQNEEYYTDGLPTGGTSSHDHGHPIEGYLQNTTNLFMHGFEVGGDIETRLSFDHFFSTNLGSVDYGYPPRFSIPFCSFSMSSPFKYSSYLENIDGEEVTSIYPFFHLPQYAIILMKEEVIDLAEKGLKSVSSLLGGTKRYLQYSPGNFYANSPADRHNHGIQTFDSNPNVSTFVEQLEHDSSGYYNTSILSHVHRMTLESEDVDAPSPPFIDIPAAYIVKDYAFGFFGHMLLLSDSVEIPIGYELFMKDDLDFFNRKLIRLGSSTFDFSNDFEGLNHTHEFNLTEDDFYYNYQCYPKNGKNGDNDLFVPECVHKHNEVNITSFGFNTSVYTDNDDFPEYFSLRLFERKESDNNGGRYEFGKTTHVTWECNGVLMDDENVCSGKTSGYCRSEDGEELCICKKSYYGYNCDEKISLEGVFDEEEETIEIEYIVEIELIQEVSESETFAGLSGEFNADQSFDCGLLIETYQFEMFSTDNNFRVKCKWVVEGSLKMTKYLKIERVTSIDSLKNRELTIIPFTSTLGDTYSNVSTVQIKYVKADENPTNDGSGLSFGQVFVITFGSIFVSLCFLCVFLIMPILLFFLFLLSFLSVFLNAQRRQLKMFAKIPELDLLLKENEEMKDRSIAHLKINHRLFEVDLSEIKIEREIGRGGTSIVYECTWQSRVCAFKMYRNGEEILFGDEEASLFKDFQTEIQILSNTTHPNILNFYGGILRPPKIGILMEFCSNGDLRSFLVSEKERGRRFSNKEKNRMFIEIASAMQYLHQRKIIHRDLKPENVLIHESLETRLMDFGFSKVTQQILSKREMTRMVGSTYYMAPEVIRGNEYSNKCDIFSFGILLFSIQTENFNPFEECEEEEGKKIEGGIEFRIASDPHFRPNIRKEIHQKKENLKEEQKELIDLMEKCWKHKQEERPKDFDEILSVLLKIGEILGDEKSEQEFEEYKKEKMENEKKIEIKVIKKEEEEEEEQNEEEIKIKELKKEIEKEKERKKELELLNQNLRTV